MFMACSLTHELGKALNEPPVAVEIIPGNGDEWLSEGTEPHKRFLLVENHLGVPSKVLYEAYLEAVAVFQRCRALSLARPDGQLPGDDPAIHDECLNSSAVLILLNPGHNTAWNARKSVILSGHRDLNKELSFTTALLTVRECAKQSLLWYHRRWLLRKTYPMSTLHHSSSSLERLRDLDVDITDTDTEDEDTLRHTNMTVETLESEFSACTLACGTYERNYFGWSHRFRCLDALYSMIRRGDGAGDPTRVARLLQLLHEESSRLCMWIEQNVSDYTAMQYRCQVDLVMQRYSRTFFDTEDSNATTSLPPFSHARTLLDSYPVHEALWLYLRGSALIRMKQDTGMIHQLQQIAERFVVDKARPEGNQSLTASSSLAEAERHALQLLSWIKWRTAKNVVSARS